MQSTESRPVPTSGRFKPIVRGIVVVFALTAIGWVGWKGVYPIWAADSALQQAKIALTDYDLADAETQLLRVREFRPDHPEATFLLAQVYRRTERYPQATLELDAARRSGWIPELLHLERVMATVQQRGPYTSDAATVRKFINAAHPEDRQLFEALCRGLMNAQQFPDAARVLDQWCDRYPDDWYPRMVRGEVRQALLSPDQAMEDYQFVLDRHPRHRQVRGRIADMHLNARKELETAVRLFTEQLTQDPTDADAEAGLAATLDLLGRREEALKHAAEALRLKPAGFRVLSLNAGLHRSTDPAAAYEFAKRAEALFPDDPPTQLLLGELTAELGRNEESRRHLDRHARLDAQWKELNLLLQAAYKAPHDPTVRCQLGRGLIAVGRLADGIMWFHSALNEKADYYPAHEQLAEVYERQQPNPVLAAQHRQYAARIKAGK
jgi:tetratricopeptide (TPR) repeat protein